MKRELLKNLLKDRTCSKCVFNQNPFAEGRKCYIAREETKEPVDIPIEETCTRWWSKEWTKKALLNY
jgi:hypothetical protein